MASPGQIPGRYNLIIADEYEAFDHQMPVEEFLQRLKDDNVPDEVSVVGLAEAFRDGDLATDLAREMDRRANDLEYQSPTIQFVVDGSFHRSGKTYDLRDGEELHSLREVFGPQFERKEDGNWITVPF